MPYDPFKHHRRSIRLKEYDYSQAGGYFITLCVRNRERLFGDIIDGEMRLNDYGNFVLEEWLHLPSVLNNVVLDEFVVMPDHFHGVIFILDNLNVGVIHELPQRAKMKERRQMLLPKIIGRFKMQSAKRINELRNTHGVPVWQRNYYEHVIRGEKDLRNIRRYIFNNPEQWLMDRDYPENIYCWGDS